MFLDPITQVVPTLATVEECDSIIEQIDDKLNTLNYKSVSGEYRSGRAVDTSSDIQANLAAANATRDSYTTLIAGLPVNSPLLESFEFELTKANFKIQTLERRQQTQGKSALIMYSVDNDAIQSQVTAFNAIKTAVQAHRATL